MFGTPGGQESSPTASAENEQNHLLTISTQKFCEAIKGFQFHLAMGIVCGEKSSNFYSKILRGNKRLSISFGNGNCLW